MLQRYLHDIVIAVEAILANKLKSVLTALGIIFGVAAVISMLAIGNGAQQEILDQIKLVGVNNIIIEPIIDESASGESDEEGEQETNKFSNGLSLLDVQSIQRVLPTVEQVSSEIQLNSFVQFNQIRRPTVLMGVDPEYMTLFNLDLEKGDFFTSHHEEHGQAVCIIGYSVASVLFSSEDAIGKYLKVGHAWLKVIGVLNKRDVIVSSSSAGLGISNTNDQVFVPTKTMLIRYMNRAVVNKKMPGSSGIQVFGGGRGMRITQTITSGTEEGPSAFTNYNQLDKIIVQVSESAHLQPTTEVLTRLLMRRHNGVADFKIIVPELLLKQEQRTKDIFNIVLGAIASISLIVGGIGIMNIMLASVMERIREIGTRQAIGASRKDIVVQFLAESTLISIVGGLIGVVLGIILSQLITRFADILTIVSPFSVVVAFGVSAAVGIIFGYLPAKRASEQDPVESLRAN